MRDFLANHRVFLPYLIVTTPLAVWIGSLTGRFALPLLQAGTVFPIYFALLSDNRWRTTFLAMSFWALYLSVIVGGLTYCYPDTWTDHFWNAQEYQQEMFYWIQTGVGKEGDISQFLPEHVFHLLLFSVLTLISGGFLGLVMGSALLNYMAHYVGSLLAVSNDFALVLFIGWPPWAIFRVLAFILVAMGLSAWSYEKGLGYRMNHKCIRVVLLAGGVLLVTDVGLKWLLASFWQEWLNAATVMLTVR